MVKQLTAQWKILEEGAGAIWKARYPFFPQEDDCNFNLDLTLRNSTSAVS